MSYHPVPTIHFAVSADKTSEITRYERGVVISDQAPNSPLYQQYPDVKGATDELVQITMDLKNAMDDELKAMATLAAARATVAGVVLKWDTSYGVWVKTGEKRAVTTNDAASLGAKPRGKTKNPLAMPLSVDFTWNAKLDYLRVHVHRAPGMRAVGVQLSPTPEKPESWFELDGNGAIHLFPHPPKGTWWARAQSRTTKGKSDFTAPVSVIVT